MEPRDPFELCGVTIDGKYRIASVIGDGGFGVVYRGVHKGFGELIAVKCLKLPTEMDETARAEFLERLQDEGRLLHRLSKATSGIVQALDVGAFTTQKNVWVPYLVMEWLEGKTLAEFLKAHPGGLGLSATMQLLAPAARALGVAHAQKIAHRDVKPANIFVSEVGGQRTAKVLDFGIAKVLADHGSTATAMESTSMVPAAFTPRYGAPEQFSKQRGATGPWTDVFAFALVIVECVSGRKALDGDDPTQLYIASADPALRPTLRARGADVPDAVEEVLRKALQVEPKHRFSDLDAFWDELVRATGEGVISSSGTSDRRRPTLDLSDSEPLLDTGTFAAKHQIDVDPLFGPTLPAESLAAKAELAKSKRDRMEETPAGERNREADLSVSKASTSTSQTRSAGASSWILPVVAVSVFAAGGAFIYQTVTRDPSVPTASTGADASSKTAPAKVSSTSRSPASAEPSVALSASAVASAEPSAIASAEPSSSVSASPSAVASSAPPTPSDPDMARIEGGVVALSSGQEETVSPFLMDRTEVTVRRYLSCQRAGECSPAGSPSGVDPTEISNWRSRCNGARPGAIDHPMNCVNFAQASAFCRWAGKRLPSEGEWERAARGAAGRKYVWGGDSPSCDKACFDRNETCMQHAQEVSTCAAGAYSDDRSEEQIFDLAGNVSEWVSSADRVTRGGNFWLGADALLTSFREARPVGYAHPTVGFRCVKAAP